MWRLLKIRKTKTFPLLFLWILTRLMFGCHCTWHSEPPRSRSPYPSLSQSDPIPNKQPLIQVAAHANPPSLSSPAKKTHSLHLLLESSRRWVAGGSGLGTRDRYSVLGVWTSRNYSSPLIGINRTLWSRHGTARSKTLIPRPGITHTHISGPKALPTHLPSASRSISISTSIRQNPWVHKEFP